MILGAIGFIHGTSLGVANSAPVALGYLIVAAVCYALTRQIAHAEPALQRLE